jgi:Rab5 GDP/GTP exchange factor
MLAPDLSPPSSASEEHAVHALPAPKSTTGQEPCTHTRDAQIRQHEILDNLQVTDRMETVNGDQHSIDKVGPPSDTCLENTTSSQTEPISGRLEKLSLAPEKTKLSNASGHLDVLPPLPQKDELHIEPSPKTPRAPPSPAGLASEYAEKELPDLPKDAASKENQETDHGRRRSEDSESEIQSIMDQFTDELKGLKQEDIMSPRLELAEQFFLTSGQFPPRKSSLEHLKNTESVSRVGYHASIQPFAPPAVPPKPSSKVDTDEPPAPSLSSVSLAARPPPEPEPDQPFDFHRFLEQLRHRTADPVAKFLRSFLTEFGKKQWMVHEQVKIISDFLAFIANKMALCEVWKNVSDAEFDNAKEGMEKLVMNRLYSQTFSPAIPPPPTIPRSVSRSKRRELERLHGPGRRGQHQEDVERDEILAQKIRIYSWVREEHLDILPVDQNGRRFLHLAQQGQYDALQTMLTSSSDASLELLKIKGYRAPRDKVICILNCCKVIFGSSTLFFSR